MTNARSFFREEKARDEELKFFPLPRNLLLLPVSSESQGEAYEQSFLKLFLDSPKPWYDENCKETFSDLAREMSVFLEKNLERSSNYGHYISLCERLMIRDAQAYAPNFLAEMKELLRRKQSNFAHAREHTSKIHCIQEALLETEHQERVRDLRRKFVGLRGIQAQALADEARQIIQLMEDKSHGLAEHSLLKTTFSQEPLLLFLILPQRSFASGRAEEAYLEAIGKSFQERIESLADPLRGQVVELRIFTEYRAGEDLGKRRGSLLGGYTPEDWTRLTPRLIQTMKEEGFTHTTPLERALLKLKNKASSCVGRLYWRKAQEWVYKTIQLRLELLNSLRKEAPLHLKYYPTQGHVTLNSRLRAEWLHRKISAKGLKEGWLPLGEKARNTPLEKKILPGNCLHASYDLYLRSYKLYAQEADDRETAREEAWSNKSKMKKKVPRKKKEKFLAPHVP